MPKSAECAARQCSLIAKFDREFSGLHYKFVCTSSAISYTSALYISIYGYFFLSFFFFFVRVNLMFLFEKLFSLFLFFAYFLFFPSLLPCPFPFSLSFLLNYTAPEKLFRPRLAFHFVHHAYAQAFFCIFNVPLWSSGPVADREHHLNLPHLSRRTDPP